MAGKQDSKSAKLRKALLDAISEEAIGDIVRGLIEAAKGGDTQAAKLLLDRSLGKQSATEAPRIAIQNNVGGHDSEALERLRRNLLNLSTPSVQPAKLTVEHQ